MQQRKLGPYPVSALGLGCMNLSHAYAAPPDKAACAAVLERALDLGISHFDTAALYGFGANESLIGEVLGPHRREFTLVSKCGMFRNAAGLREIDGRPAVLRQTVEDSLKRLRTEVIDLCYLHRWDKRVPIEESVGALADLLQAGKIRAIGLSEVSATTLRRAHAVHPVAALQTEYSLWTRNPEIAVLAECRRLGVTFVAFSPLARGFLAGGLSDVAALEAKDIRRFMPRFEPDNYAANLKLFDAFAAIAAAQGCTPAQLALAWLLAQGEDILPIPGTTRLAHLEENAAAADLTLGRDVLDRLDALINQTTVVGHRYSAAIRAEIDTEDFA
ncbi:MAG: aldo/keto reductase [Rhodocyclales bacterium]|nr:aldo/keto reductase [Rhodocyclales bacterium]